MTERSRLLLHCNLLKAILLLLFFIWLHGCVRLPVTGTLPPDFEAGSSLPVAPGSSLAWHPDGERVAVATEDGLAIWTPGTGELKSISADSPIALVWSPDGSRLAAAFSRNGDTELVILGTSGEREHTAVVSGKVADLLWGSDQGLLAIATSMQLYSFGGGFKLVLHRWSVREPPETTVLHESSLKPVTLRRWQSLLHRTPHPALSPLGDELLYARLHDPPAFSPYLKIILRHLETGAERQIASVPVTAGAAIFADAGESVIYGDGMVSHMVDPWSGGKREAFSTPGQNVSISWGGRYLYLDGHLYRDGALLTSFPAGSAASFSPRGDKMLVLHKDRLFPLFGLEDVASPPISDADRRQLLKLRKWRSSGLISPEDYLEQKRRILE